MKILEDQFRAWDAPDANNAASQSENREDRYERDAQSIIRNNDAFNQNSVLKTLFQREISEGM
ncbi:MAG: hypothetical protein H6581_20115 [Bacteroidia bacterium]|nr:hypothetical protein [Bacteroidia bacterium]